MCCSKGTGARVLLMILNAPLFLAGGLIFVAGVLLKVSSGFLSADAVTLLNKIEYENLQLGNLLDALAFLMIILGGLVFIIAILGMCGAWKKIKCCIILYVLITVILLLTQAVMVGLWVHYRGRADEWLEGQMLNLLADYKGPHDTDEISKGWNNIFMDAECCGVRDQYKDGGTNNDFIEMQSVWRATGGGTDEQVPATCCKGVERGTIADYEDSPTCTSPDPPINFYTDGCYEKMKTYVKDASLFIILICAVVFIVQVVAIVSSCVFMDSLKKRVRHGGNQGSRGNGPAQPPPYIGIDAVLKNKGRQA